jgi:hypothetical protein
VRGNEFIAIAALGVRGLYALLHTSYTGDQYTECWAYQVAPWLPCVRHRQKKQWASIMASSRRARLRTLAPSAATFI